jgi:hypothetical protein
MAIEMRMIQLVCVAEQAVVTDGRTAFISPSATRGPDPFHGRTGRM